MKSWEWNRMQRTFESSKQLIVRIDVIKKAYRKLALKWHPGNFILREFEVEIRILIISRKQRNSFK